MKKTLTMVLAFALVFALGVGGTLAWLTAETTEVKNTFTVGDINIELDETVSNEFHFVPGDKLAKDPYVTVKANSEKCYVFVKAVEANNTYNGLTGDIINWSVVTGENEWKQVAGTDIYWRVVENSTNDQTFYILTGEGTGEYKNGVVTVNTGVTKAMVNGNTVGVTNGDIGIEENKPTLTFDAFAYQFDNTTETDAIAAAKAHFGA